MLKPFQFTTSETGLDHYNYELYVHLALGIDKNEQLIVISAVVVAFQLVLQKCGLMMTLSDLITT